MLQEINVSYVLEDSTVGQKKFPSKRISLLLRFFRCDRAARENRKIITFVVYVRRRNEKKKKKKEMDSRNAEVSPYFPRENDAACLRGG